MKRWRLGASALAVLATVGVCVLFLPALRQTARPAAALSSHPIRWVLDAGHGGEDVPEEIEEDSIILIASDYSEAEVFAAELLPL